MTRHFTFVRPNLFKYRKVIFIIFAILFVTAYPLFRISEYLSAYFLIDMKYRAGDEVVVDYKPQIKVYDNYFDDHKVNFTEIMVRHINEAQNQIYASIYSFNLGDIRDALAKASDRGVDVTIIYNANRSLKFEAFLGNKKKKFTVFYAGVENEPEDHYSMHHKYMIVDPGLPSEILLTGPWNWSHFQEDLDPNILLEIKDPEIIESYVEETKRILRGNYGYKKFRDLNYIPWDKKITYSNDEVTEIWISPGRKKNSIESRIIDLIDEANQTIDVGITIFNSDIIARKLIGKAKEGVEVRIVIDVQSNENDESIIPWVKEKISKENLNNITIYEGGTRATEENPDYSIFHYHNLIIDNEIVLTSTANWTYGGFFLNDENTLIFYSENVAEQFTELFEKYLDYLNK